MAEFLTGSSLDSKLTDILWEAKKDLIILSPFIRLDEYCVDLIKKLKDRPNLKIIIVFGKNEGETQRSLIPADLDLFKTLSNVTIIYCKNLHAKFYANEDEALLTSLNLLGKSMTENVEYGVCFSNSKLNLDKIYVESMNYTYEVVTTNPVVFIKRPIFKKELFGLTKKFIDSKILYDKTSDLYGNRNFDYRYYEDFDKELMTTDEKPSRESFALEEIEEQITPKYKQIQIVKGYCIRTGTEIDFNPQRPFCYNAYKSWANFNNDFYPEKFCHKTGKKSEGRTSKAFPVLFFTEEITEQNYRKY